MNNLLLDRKECSNIQTFSIALGEVSLEHCRRMFEVSKLDV
jgi:hypothetical protein